MKNKLKIVDVNILSSYMGNWLTLAIVVFVFAVTVSALMSGGGGTERNIVNIYVSASDETRDPVVTYDPLRRMLSARTRRPAVVELCKEAWPPGGDVYVIPIADYLALRDQLGIVALFSVSATERQKDRSVIVARSSDTPLDLSQLSVREMAFTSPHSINGFLLPLAMLSDDGVDMPQNPGDFHFEGAQQNATRVVLGVICGEYRAGGCTLNDVTTLTDRGVIHMGELRILRARAALPEVLIAAPRRESGYFRRKFSEIDGLMIASVSAAGESEPVKLLKSFGIMGLKPIDPAEIDEAGRLIEQYHSLFGEPGAGKP
jgi:hypothetical protein